MIEAMPAPPSEPPWREFARAPLVPPALGAAVGLAADRLLSVPFEASFAVALIGAIGVFIHRRRAWLGLFLLAAGLAAVHHHYHRNSFPADDLGNFATDSMAIVKIRGFIDEQPILRKADRSELFGPARRIDRAITVVTASSILQDDIWIPASGRVRVAIERDIANDDRGLLEELGIGDEVELVGLLSKPSSPGNPGERDYASLMLDQRIRSELRITKNAEGLTRLAESPGWSWGRMLATLRGKFTNILRETLPESDQPLARALLLGDMAATDQDDWDAFARTGVLHVLAISGQHLVILAGAVWWLLRFSHMPRGQGAWAVLILIVFYAALTGGRPSATRAAVMVTIFCVGIIVRRPVNLANAFALAWMIVVAIDPCEAISFGSLLSFIAVFVLIWCAARWVAPSELSPVEQLKQEARTSWERALRKIGRLILVAYAVNLIITFANMPLLIAMKNVAPPISILIGPPVIFLTTIALIAGFLQLVIGLISPLLAAPFALITGESLSLSKTIVTFSDNIPYGTVYVPDPPTWWVVGFYVLLVILVLMNSRSHIKYWTVLVLWTLLGLVGIPARSTDELRITFLSVGHGGCTVIETPDGRVLVYDAGTMAGPNSVKHIVAPFLWHCGIRRIDELFLSHADLDHYNGVPQLLRRFPVGQVTLTPSFATKPTPEVAEVLVALDRYSVPRRIAVVGDSFTAGDVRIDVLHPPRDGPAGSENERSLVLKITHANHSILLTGDLEKTGTSMLLAQPPQLVDVMMAPHHGSPAAFPTALARWADPKLVVVCRGPRSGKLPLESWDTWTHGAVTLRSHSTGLLAETFRTKERVVVKRGK